MADDAHRPRGAYGLTLPGLPGQQWLLPAPASWPTWEVQAGDFPFAGDQELSDQHAVLRSLSGAIAHIDRARATTTIRPSAGPEPDAAYVHPLLAVTAIVHANWEGRLAFHAGSFLDAGGGVWAVLGDREAGKSSTLAWLARHGVAIYADDVLITDGRRALVGPRCLDLREGAAGHFGLGRDIGVIGLRRRWRVDLPDVPTEAPLRGWILLEWATTPRCAPVPVAQRRDTLHAHRGMKVQLEHPLAWLDALALPMIRFGRPRSWDALDGAMTSLLAEVERHRPA